MKLTSLLVRRFLVPGAKVATKEEAIRLLADLESGAIEIKRSFTVADIMSSRLHTVRPETSLKEVMDLFYKHRISYARWSTRRVGLSARSRCSSCCTLPSSTMPTGWRTGGFVLHGVLNVSAAVVALAGAMA